MKIKIITETAVSREFEVHDIPRNVMQSILSEVNNDCLNMLIADAREERKRREKTRNLNTALDNLLRAASESGINLIFNNGDPYFRA